MGGISLGSSRHSKHHRRRGDTAVAEEIEGLIRVHRDGRVERFPVVKDVPCTLSPDSVASGDVSLHLPTLLWARVYVPFRQAAGVRHPVLLYFHGGGFCVGSASWACYHDFLARLSAAAGCAVVSVNYRLAPEHRLPAAYDDGVRATRWAAALRGDGGRSWWSSRCDFSTLFVAGDSAGAAIAYHVALRTAPDVLRGAVLIQPFFGGEARTASERRAPAVGSALTLAASDSYWRLALPVGAGRDHLWCNPLAAEARETMEAAPLPPVLVCVAEADMLRDRNMELCRAMRRAGKDVEVAVHGGVGHAFHILGGGSRLAEARTTEMMTQIKSFIVNVSRVERIPPHIPRVQDGI